MSHSLRNVLTLEKHFFASAPSLEKTLHESGWLLRSSSGYTKRGNSASPVEPTSKLDSKTVSKCLHFLSDPPIFRITPLAHREDDLFLHSRGWSLLDPSTVMIMDLSKYNNSVTIPHRVSVGTVPVDWMDGFSAASNLTTHQAETLNQTLNLIPGTHRSAFLTLLDKQSLPLAYGQAVYSDKIVGLYNIVVDVTQRGKGYGKTMTRMLLDWGKAEGATQGYLQVRKENPVAVGLYASLGFKEEYNYHYRIGPTGGR